MMPVGLGLEITDRCDLACAHCLRAIVPPQAPRARDLDVELVRRIVAEAKELGIQWIGLTGGEPMLHPGFMDIVDIIVDSGVKYHFLSNGLGIPALIPQWLQRPERRDTLRDICISMDGATEATHDTIRGTGAYRRTLAGIAVLRALGIPFSLLYAVNRVNRHEVEQMGLLAHHLGAHRLYYSHFLPNGRPHATADLDLSIRERDEVEAIIKRLSAALRLDIFIGEGYHTDKVDHHCETVQKKVLNVDPNGHLTFCCELSNFYGDDRAAESRSDFVADLARVSLAEAIARQSAAVDRFREERLADAEAGRFTEDDYFACRYCVRHFGKPDRDIVRIRRKNTAASL